MHLPRVGMAGWVIPTAAKGLFPGEGRDLERYAARFNAVEVNSTFYRRPHPTTYNRWCEITPSDFRFAIKLHYALTYQSGLAPKDSPLWGFADDLHRLGNRLGALIVQLPRDLRFDRSAEDFFAKLNARGPGHLICDAGHDSWFGRDADQLLSTYHVTRAGSGERQRPGGWPGVVYSRLRATGKLSSSMTIAGLAKSITLPPPGAEAWFIFDNNTSGAALACALTDESSQVFEGRQATEPN